MKSIRYIFPIFIILISLLTVSCGDSDSSTAGQGEARSMIRAGNRTFHANNQDSPAKAELYYRKAMSADMQNPQAIYNLGVSMLAQNKDSSAYSLFAKASELETSKPRRALSFHNMGVIMQKQQQFSQAIECYKQALRLVPHDSTTRYNMVLCMRQKSIGNNNNQNQNNKDKNKDKDKDKDKQNQQNKNQQDKNQQDKNQQDKNQQENKQQQPPQQKMSKENAEQLLQAAMQNEKATQQRLKKAMSQPRRRNLQKNW